MTIFKYGPWYRWLAWHPVHVIPFVWRRLVHVKRRRWGIDGYTMDGIDASSGYEHHPAIKAPVAV